MFVSTKSWRRCVATCGLCSVAACSTASTPCMHASTTARSAMEPTTFVNGERRMSTPTASCGPPAQRAHQRFAEVTRAAGDQDLHARQQSTAPRASCRPMTAVGAASRPRRHRRTLCSVHRRLDGLATQRGRLSAGSRHELRGARSLRARQTTARRRLRAARRILFRTHRHLDRRGGAAASQGADSVLQVCLESACRCSGRSRRVIGAAPALRVPPALMAPWLYAGRGDAGVATRACGRRCRDVSPIDHSRARGGNPRGGLPAVASTYRRAMLYLRAKADRLIPASAGRTIIAVATRRRAGRNRCARISCCRPNRNALCARPWSASWNTDAESPIGRSTSQQSLRVSKLTAGRSVGNGSRVAHRKLAPSWRKVARIVGDGDRRAVRRAIPDVPDIYYAQRVRHLVEVGKLESQGNLAVHALQRGAIAREVTAADAGGAGGLGAARASIPNHSRPMQLA